MPTIHCYFENKAAAACATSALNKFCSICTAFRCLHRIWDRPAIPSPPKNLTQEEINAYDLLLDTTEDLVTTLEQEDLLCGTLTRTLLEDALPPDCTSPTSADQTKKAILRAASDPMRFQFFLNSVLYDMRDGIALDLDQKYRTSLLPCHSYPKRSVL